MDESQHTNAKPEERVIIRRYTDGLTGSNALEKAVQEYPVEPLGPWAEKKERKERQLWQEVFDDSKASREFLKAEWDNFRKTLPEIKVNKRRWLSKPKHDPAVDSKSKQLDITNLTQLESTVHDCEDVWKSQNGVLGQTVTARFHKVCQWVVSHRIFDLFPSQNEYVSVICGSINLLMQVRVMPQVGTLKGPSDVPLGLRVRWNVLTRDKASVRHVEYAEELSQSLEKVFAELELDTISVGIMNTEPMRQRLSKLYAQVFAFLHDAMTWWASKTRSKFRDAFNGSLQKSLKDRISEIERLGQNLRNFAEASHFAESRDHRLTSEETNDIVRDTNNLARRTHCEVIELSKAWEEYRRQDQALRNRKAVAFTMNQALLENLRDEVYQIFQLQPQQAVQGLPGDVVSVKNLAMSGSKPASAEQPSKATLHFLKTEVLIDAQHLEDHIIGKSRLREAMVFPISMDHLIVHGLQQWSVALSPQLLWIIGPSDHALPSNMSPAAMTIVLTAAKLNVPIVSHFCALPPYGHPSREQAGLIGLVYSLILQLLAQMPPEIDTGIDLAASRFQGLDGSIESWDESLDLLADLLEHFSLPLLLCVIDGLGRLDFEDGSPLCGQLVEVLQKNVERTGSEMKLKVLFTTSGKSSGQDAALPRMIPEGQRLYTDQRQGRPASGRPLIVSNHLSHSMAE